MTVERHQVVGLLGVGAGLVAMVVSARPVLTGTLRWVALLSTTLAAAAGLGHSQFVSDRRSEHDKRPFFESPVLYTAWWGSFYALFFHAMVTIDSRTLLDSVLPGWLPGVAFLTLLLASVALGGVNPAFTLSHWRDRYRDGKRRARSRSGPD